MAKKIITYALNFGDFFRIF